MSADMNEGLGLSYPITKMNFMVTVQGLAGSAAFTEITGVDSSVDVIEFRQGNANTHSLLKLPGLVHHGNVTMRMGITNSMPIMTWITDCVNDQRKAIERHDILIELLNSNQVLPTTVPTSGPVDSANSKVWTLKDAWVCKFNAPDLDAKTSDVAIVSIEVAFERMEYPKNIN